MRTEERSMSRFSDYADFEGAPEQILAQGRWERNARAVLHSKRGRKALAEIREALMALPERRLIEGAVCTVGDVDARYPAVTDAEMEERAAKAREWQAEAGHINPDYPAYCAEILREERDEAREAYMNLAQNKGAGVCLIGAYVWHQKVRSGMDPAEAFAAIPVVLDSETADALGETAEIGKEAGLAYTLAWELAYRNDETYASKTPEERWTAFVEWIDKQLMEGAAA
jgi:hypothetical protein